MSTNANPDGSANKLANIWREPAFQLGIRDQSSASVGIAAWGLVTGIAMIKSGLSIPLAFLMTFLVYAGSSQLATLPLIASGSPLWIIWFTGICVNLRFVIFSSSWREHFGHLPRAKRIFMTYMNTDMLFVMFFKRYAKQPPSTEQLSYYWAGALTTWLAWQVASVTGILLAQVIPLCWGLGFAGTLAILGVTLSLLVDRPTWLATAVAGAAAIAAFALPLKLNILVAIAAAVAIGLIYEATEKKLSKHKANSTPPDKKDPQ